MSKRQPRIDIVRTAAGWHGRFRAANGEPVWTTETYSRRRRVLRAIELLDHFAADVRDVDERDRLPANLDDAQALGLWATGQAKVRAEIKADRKIHAIKELRRLTGSSLLQAKNAMDCVMPNWRIS